MEAVSFGEGELLVERLPAVDVDQQEQVDAALIALGAADETMAPLRFMTLDDPSDGVAADIELLRRDLGSDPALGQAQVELEDLIAGGREGGDGMEGVALVHRVCRAELDLDPGLRSFGRLPGRGTRGMPNLQGGGKGDESLVGRGRKHQVPAGDLSVGLERPLLVVDGEDLELQTDQGQRGVAILQRTPADREQPPGVPGPLLELVSCHRLI